MRKRNLDSRPIAKALAPAETEEVLQKIGRLIQKIRKERTTLESFSYEINVSRSAQAGYENGKDMYLSTFLRLLHGLDIPGEEFFKELKKTK